MKNSVVLSEAVKGILGKDKNLVYAYSLGNEDYYVSSDVFFDQKQGTDGLLMVVHEKEKDSELVLHLPYLMVGRNKGFSSSRVKKIISFLSKDQLATAFSFCPKFAKKYIAGV